MEDNRDVYKFVNEWFTLYGIIITIMLIITVTVTSLSDEVSKISTMFSLGSKGIPINALWQWLLLSFLISVYRLVFMTDTFIKDMSVIKRSVILFSLAFATAVVFSIVFKWFPIDSIESWIGFIVCYALAVYKSASISKKQDRKMQEALEKYNRDHKTEWEDSEM